MEKRDHLYDETLAFRLQYEEIAGVYKAFQDRKPRNRYESYNGNSQSDPHQAYLAAKMQLERTQFDGHSNALVEPTIGLGSFPGQRRSVRSESLSLTWNNSRWSSSTQLQHQQQPNLHEIVDAWVFTQRSSRSPSDLSSERDRSPSGSSSSTAPVSPPFNQTVFAKTPLSPSRFKFDPFSQNIMHNTEDDDWHDIISETRNMNLKCDADA